MTWIRAAAARAVLAAARSRGLEPTQVLATAGVKLLPSDPSASVPLTVHFALMETCTRLLKDPGFVIDLADHVPVEAYDVMGFAMRSAPDLATAVEVGRRYQPLYTCSSVFDVERASGLLHIWMRPSGPLPLAARLATESAVTQWLAIARKLCGVAIVPEQVSFRHAAPRSTARHVAFYGVTPVWEAPLAAMKLKSADAELPVQQADPTLHAFLLRAAEAALAEHRPPVTLVDQTRRVVAELLPSGKLDIDHAAARLGLASRTLRRRLGEHETTFQRLCDEVRESLARQYLAERSLPIAEVAFLLDFADERAFRRSFQRWTGSSPAQFRNALATS